MTDFWALLRPLERIESLLAEIYDAAANSFGQDPEAARLFARLALDERSHATQVQYLQRIARQGDIKVGDVGLDLAEIRAIVDDLEHLRRTIGKLSLDEVITLSTHAEEGAAETHGRSALARAAGEIGGLLRNLGQGDRNHAQTLRDFARRRGIRLPEPIRPPSSQPGR